MTHRNRISEVGQLGSASTVPTSSVLRWLSCISQLIHLMIWSLLRRIMYCLSAYNQHARKPETVVLLTNPLGPLYRRFPYITRRDTGWASGIPASSVPC